MSKIDLKIKLTGPEENIDLIVPAIRLKNEYKYSENNVKVSLSILDDKIRMKRTCNEYEIDLVFKEKEKTISKYKLFGASKIFDLETYTKKMIINDNKIIINYELEGNKFEFTLEVI